MEVKFEVRDGKLYKLMQLDPDNEEHAKEFARWMATPKPRKDKPKTKKS